MIKNFCSFALIQEIFRISAKISKDSTSPVLRDGTSKLSGIFDALIPHLYLACASYEELLLNTLALC